MSIHKSSAKWQGNLPEGKGKMIIGNGAWEGNYSFKSRFEDGEGKGTSPEELIAAAHAGCFSMAFSHALNEAGFKPEFVETEGAVTLGKVEGGFAITKIKLTSKGKAEGIDEQKFKEIAMAAKENCPVSQALKSVEISLEITMVD